jgi:ABC-type dipeptide/oligopeptide/nickel transport system permease subunit
MSNLRAYVRHVLPEAGPARPGIFLSWPELAEYVHHATRVLRAIEYAEALAARQTEDLRIAQNRIHNAVDAIGEVQLCLRVGDNAAASRAAAAAGLVLTFELPEGV